MTSIEIRKAILELADTMPLDWIDIKPIVEKCIEGLSFEEEAEIRSKIRTVADQLEKAGDLNVQKVQATISMQSGGSFPTNSLLVKTTIKREKEKETNKPPTIIHQQTIDKNYGLAIQGGVQDSHLENRP